MAPDIAETHISWVFFTPDRAYKLLKPVAMPFLDHTTSEQRIAATAREYELNKRIAPDVYLGTADIIEDGLLADRILVMRRLPASRRLTNLIADPRFPQFLRATSRAIATLHAGREPVYDSQTATVDAVAENWQENFDVIRPHAGSVIDESEFARVERLVQLYLGGRRGLFERRISQGMVRDVHGDLIADDIYCLDDGPRIIDCLAFNDKWRVIDVLADIAFLVMDVHRLAGLEPAERVMAWYHEFSNEQHPASLAHHYVAYRAHVRAKVACLRHEQGDAESRTIAREYHRLALHHLERARVRMILVGGGPGAGKSTLANGLGVHFGFPVLATDEIRKDLTFTPHSEHRFAAPGKGIYDAATTDLAYAEQRREAECLIQAGSGVIVDASWSNEAHRAAARSLARTCGAELIEIECNVDPAIAKERIARRLSDVHNTSDATPDLVDYMAKRREPWPEAIKISTESRPSEVVAAVVSAIATQPLDTK